MKLNFLLLKISISNPGETKTLLKTTYQKCNFMVEVAHIGKITKYLDQFLKISKKSHSGYFPIIIVVRRSVFMIYSSFTILKILCVVLNFPFLKEKKTALNYATWGLGVVYLTGCTLRCARTWVQDLGSRVGGSFPH